MPSPILRAPRLVVVGYGFAGRAFHSYLISLVPGLMLHGIVSRNPETRQKIQTDRPGVKIYDTLEAALTDPDVDGVVFATPHDTHHPYALAAFAAGKHVVTDKPMCLSLQQCREMFDAARRADRHLFVFHNRRWDSDFLTLQDTIAKGLLGPPDSVRWIEMAWNRFGTWKSWRASAARGGGRLYDLGSHMLDQLLLLLPAPVKTVYCRAHTDFPDSDTPSHCQVTLTFEDGRTGVMDCTSMSRHEKPRMLAMGPEGTFLKHGVDPQEAAMIKGEIDSAIMPETEWPKLLTKDGPRLRQPIPGRWRTFYEHVEQVLTGKASPLVTEAQMLRLMSAFEAAHESIRTGQVVEMKQVE